MSPNEMNPMETEGSALERNTKSRIKPFASRPAETLHMPEPPSMQPFPLEALPKEAQQMVLEVARVSFTEPRLVAVQTLAWIAAALGKGVVSVSGDMITYPNLFILGIAETGSGKSESARRLSVPFERLGAAELESWRQATEPEVDARLREIQSRIGFIDKENKNNGSGYSEADRKSMQELLREKKELEGKKNPPRLQVEDATQEALADALLSYDQSLLCYSTDAGKVVSNLLGRYAGNTAGGKLKEDTAFLKGYSVETLRVDRVAKSQTITEPCIATLWLIQPGKIPLLFGDEGLCDGGFMPRMMPCLTSGGLPQRSLQSPILQGVQSGWNSLIEGLFKLRKNGGAVQSQSRTVFQVSQEAWEIWNKWDNENREKTKTGSLGDVSAFVSRWGEWAQRIAVNLQAAKFLKNTDCDKINPETMAEAIQIAQWFADEQLRVLHASRVSAREKERKRMEERKNKLHEILIKRAENRMSLADFGRRHRFSEEEIRKLTEMFSETFGIEERQTNTKPSTVCFLR